MAPGSVTDFLIRAVLDEGFRELAIADPERAFEEYDLSPQQRESLRRRDGRVLGLLGEPPPPPAEEPTASADLPALPKLPAVKLLLSLTPQVAQLPDSTSTLRHAATLSPWPGDEEAKRADGETSHVAWVIRIAPTVLEQRDEGLNVAYSAAIQPLGAYLVESPPVAQEGAGSPWNHQVDSEAAKAAAEAVRASDAGTRCERLLDLIHALQRGDRRD